MSTRGAIGFRIDQKDYIAFNHWDSYPSGLGKDVLEQLKSLSREDWTELPNRVRKIYLIEGVFDQLSSEELDVIEARAGEDWESELGEAQGNLTPYMTGKLTVMCDSHTFMADSLFCEFAYIVNLDDGVLEFYKGFNKAPDGQGRYAHLESDGYYGVRLIDTVPLSEIHALSIESVLQRWTFLIDSDQECPTCTTRLTEKGCPNKQCPTNLCKNCGQPLSNQKCVNRLCLMTLNEIVAELETAAQNENCHDLIDVYWQLAGILNKHAGSTVTLKVMREIYSIGGFLR